MPIQPKHGAVCLLDDDMPPTADAFARPLVPTLDVKLVCTPTLSL
jgi:hypothetical protein